MVQMNEALLFGPSVAESRSPGTCKEKNWKPFPVFFLNNWKH